MVSKTHPLAEFSLLRPLHMINPYFLEEKKNYVKTHAPKDPGALGRISAIGTWIPIG